MSAVQPFEAFRPLTSTDLDQVMRIEERVYPYPWSRRIFQDCLWVGYYCRALTCADQVAGYGIMSHGAGEAHILNLAIDSLFQGKGYAKAMLNDLLHAAGILDCERVLLEVRPSNKVALSIYKQAGFSRIGIRRDYYPAKGGTEDAFVLHKLLSDKPTLVKSR